LRRRPVRAPGVVNEIFIDRLGYVDRDSLHILASIYVDKCAQASTFYGRRRKKSDAV
jgi:hypothetical protein